VCAEIGQRQADAYLLCQHGDQRVPARARRRGSDRIVDDGDAPRRGS
jgi:hypothetical protein